jgi:ATP-dependent Clp protease ATP-binding subunit ClpA
MPPLVLGSFVASNLTRRARAGEIEPTFRRDREARALLAALELGTSIPLVSGEHGVGKTRIIERAVELALGDPVLDARWGKTSFLLLYRDFDTRHRTVHRSLSEIHGAFFDALAKERESGPIVVCFPILAPGDLPVMRELREQGYLVLVETLDSLVRIVFNLDYASRSMFQRMPVSEPDLVETRALLESQAEAKGWEVEPAVLDAALSVSGRFSPGDHNPAKACRVLAACVTGHMAQEAAEPLRAVGVYSYCSQAMHLPLALVSDDVCVSESEVVSWLRSDVVGQDDAVRRLASAVLRLKAGTADPDRPLGAYLFAGPTGVGKTQLARALARVLSGGDEEQALVRINVGETLKDRAANRELLYGSPDQNVLRLRHGLLSWLLRGRVTAVLLLDELDKGDGEVHELLFQLVDEGRFTDGAGVTVPLQNVVVIATTTVGAEVFHGTPPGFHASDEMSDRLREMECRVMDRYGVEFLNRLDAVCLFRPFSADELEALVRLRVERSLARVGVVARGLEVTLERAAVEMVAERGVSGRFGARHLERAVEEMVVDPVTHAIVAGRVMPGDAITLRVREQGSGLEVVPCRTGIEQLSPAGA